MTQDQKALLISLAIASGICEFLGTLTVWRSFKSTAFVARTILQRIEQDTTAQSIESQDVMHSLAMGNSRNVDFELNKLRKSNREFLGKILAQLTWNQETAWGLRAFFTGAVLGTIAAVLALVW